MLKKAYLLAKIGADTAENEQHFAENSTRCRRLTGRTGRFSPRGSAGHARLEHPGQQAGARAFSNSCQNPNIFSLELVKFQKC